MESQIRQTLDAPKGTKIIETFGFSVASGHVRLPNHLARMQRTAQALGYPFDIDQALLATAVHVFDSDHRCRLTLDAKGQFEFSATPFAPVQGEWVVSIASERLSSDDVWLSHKTTQRGLYDRVRADLPSGIDEVLFLNERDELCEGTITNIIVHLAGGGWVTPPVSSGVLPGVYRQFEIDQNNVAEAVVSLDDLRQAQAIWLVNSLRGRIKARLAP